MNYKKHLYMIKQALLLLAFLILPMQTAFAESIGMVLAVQGSVSAMREGVSVPLSVKDPISVKDTILTGPNSKIQILLNDESSITIGPDSSLELREFADAGENSKFNAHIGQGMMRVITGRVTEANPDGFKVTTPLATVGIRGTMIVFKITKDQDIIDFQNSSQTLFVNGTPISENNRIIITGSGSTTVNPLSQEDRTTNESFNATTGSGNSNIDDDNNTLTALTETNGISFGNSPNLLSSNLDTTMQNIPSTSTGLIVGNVLNDGMPEGGFSFNVNLQSGAITNASSSGFNSSFNVGWNIQGGSGAFDGSGNFRIDGFSGTMDNASIDPSNTFMEGRGSYKNINDTVEGVINVQEGMREFMLDIDGSRVQ